MAWGNGNVTIKYTNLGQQYTVTVTDPDNVSTWMIREFRPNGTKVKDIKAGNGNCTSPVTATFTNNDLTAQANDVRVSWMDCQSPAGEVWELDPTIARGNPGVVKQGRRMPQSTPLNPGDQDGDEKTKKT